MKKKEKNPCEGCVWGRTITEEKIFCPFPRCVKGTIPLVDNRKEREKPDGGPGEKSMGR
ncbi:hypothetical protein [uncultured Dysosmobacter sp.]|uniref:hypothetical protein n=1 Tax=uncultured Dysosmobacter sp. TaxID=2591384 RepID=UPI002619BA74|nr:hypothetical protein [uncultured Dysosmobacter sp.]